MAEHTHTPRPWVAHVAEEPDRDGLYDFNVAPDRPGEGFILQSYDPIGIRNRADGLLIAAAPELLESGWALSTWAAAIKWSDRETNTAEWLDGLRERIERFQAVSGRVNGADRRRADPDA